MELIARIWSWSTSTLRRLAPGLTNQSLSAAEREIRTAAAVADIIALLLGCPLRLRHAGRVRRTDPAQRDAPGSWPHWRGLGFPA